MTPSPYEVTREAWMRQHGVEIEAAFPAYACDISFPASGERLGEDDQTETIHFEELSAAGEPCAGYQHSRNRLMSFGSTTRVLSALSGLVVSHEWVTRTAGALERERSWRHDPMIGMLGRRRLLQVFTLAGSKFHVSSVLNRDSIAEHGLDWIRMGAAPSVVRKLSPELPGIFVEDRLEACDFFIRMARFPVDVWEINVDGLWGESGPDGWVVIPEPIPSERVRLVRKDAPRVFPRESRLPRQRPEDG